MVNLYDLFYSLQSSGFYDIVLPFLLFFIIIFAILEKTMILGHTGVKNQFRDDRKPKTNLNVIAAVVISLIVILQTPTIELINSYLTNMAMWILIAVMGLLVFALFAEGGFNGVYGWIAGIIALIAVVLSLSYDARFGTFFGNWNVSPDVIETALLVGVVVAVIGLVVWGSNRNRRAP